jgi:hypothetical protein
MPSTDTYVFFKAQVRSIPLARQNGDHPIEVGVEHHTVEKLLIRPCEEGRRLISDLEPSDSLHVKIRMRDMAPADITVPGNGTVAQSYDFRRHHIPVEIIRFKVTYNLE